MRFNEEICDKSRIHRHHRDVVQLMEGPVLEENLEDNHWNRRGSLNGNLHRDNLLHSQQLIWRGCSWEHLRDMLQDRLPSLDFHILAVAVDCLFSFLPSYWSHLLLLFILVNGLFDLNLFLLRNFLGDVALEVSFLQNYLRRKAAGGGGEVIFFLVRIIYVLHGQNSPALSQHWIVVVPFTNCTCFLDSLRLVSRNPLERWRWTGCLFLFCLSLKRWNWFVSS